MLRNRPPYLLLLSVLLLGFAACDNIGRAFDPSVDPSDPGNQTGTSPIQIVPVGGETRSGRPTVRAAYPEGSGWPATVPIVFEFSESLNEASILPTSPNATDGLIGVRLQGSTQFLPAQYDFLAMGRLLVIRPITPLPDQGGAAYEVVLLSEGRDVDGVRFQVTGGERILSEFQVNQDASITDGSIVAIYPRDNYGEQPREGNMIVVFDSPANVNSLVSANMTLQAQGGAGVTFDIEFPVATVGVADPRVIRLDPDVKLLASQVYQFSVTSNITFGQDGNLDFSGRTPFSRFTTIAPAAPTSIALGNALVGFPNKINRDNALNVILNVETPADTVAGDVVVARIYGGDALTTQTFDFTFEERTAVASAAGAQTVALDFGAQLGTLATPKLDDGDVTFAAKITRGSQATGFIHQGSSDAAIFDITRPTLVQAGPPGTATDIYTDSESLSYYGTASEGLAAVTLADTGTTAAMFGSNSTGGFLVLPIPLGRLTSARSYNIGLTDLAGNTSHMTVAGVIRQRGQITGTLAGTLTVEAFDYATLEPIAGATVLVDPATPSSSGVGQLIGTTGADGRVAFTNGLGSAHTITIVRAGYDLITMYDTQAALVSLPLTPLSNATATLRGTAALTPAPGATVIVGSSAFADHSVMGARTSNAAPTQIPATPILPNRAQILTAFGGTFEPTTVPTYSAQACQIFGPTLLTPTAPPAPAEPGGETNASLGIRIEDFGLAVGLDTANLVDGLPRSRVTTSLSGFDGQVLTGIGTVSLQGGTMYDVDANFSLPIIAGLIGFSPVSWLVTEAEDTIGRMSRTRVLLNPDTGQIVPGFGPSPIPVITAPSGAFTGSPAVTIADVLNPALVPGSLALLEVTATDANGRRWHVIATDRDAATGTDSVQFPNLSSQNVAGLVAGAWQVRAEARLALSVTLSSIDDFVLAERYRQEVNLSRSRAVTFTIN